MTHDTEALPGDPLPRLTPPWDTGHPVLAAVLAETRQRDPHEPLIAYYEDAP
ncbi:hypothetical protein ACIPW9_07755 [Streptomyces sp. NPDC090052]|uniref:hypothetical protein n=1 Tax=unclassified Streptomyces TaxID=2593676 RepID=UPI00224D3445|nr:MULTISPECIES: hypothetical protein [unclassified Streptomyces]MCX4723803.1 hypothetical protein [Streptomyces sp. NBC_01306]WSV06620.1 hypothetical protein OG372_25310 [Streptomyces sp. NBC_01020]WSX44740.1 hypothetical protein OG760_25300 [Streptomyces sp. NBC_00963]WSX67245.1 hypothetical protein OG221_11815 [Streptomyces sp. NBC_00932]